MKHKIYLILTLTVLSLGLCICANAQKNARLFKGFDWKKAVEAARNGQVELDREVLARFEEGYSESKTEVTNDLFVQNAPPPATLTGTWFITVPGATPAENFYAYQTFGADGTFVETSSLLATLTEGPAHGVWEAKKNFSYLTFELFAFDPETRTQVGRIRVRNIVRLNGRNNLIADSVADFIDNDGTVTPNIGTGVFTGERVTIKVP